MRQFCYFTIALLVMCADDAVRWSASAQTDGLTVREFGALMVENQIPTGIVLPESALTFHRPARQPATTDSAARAAFRANIGAFLGKFSTQNPSLRAEFTGRTIRLQAVDLPSPVKDLLAQEVLLQEHEGNPQALLFGVVMPAVRGQAPGGVAGSGISPACQTTGRARLSEGSIRVGAILDALVMQSPDVAWLVTYEQDKGAQGLQMGFICRDGSSVKARLYH
jgi:hypothetical protein